MSIRTLREIFESYVIYHGCRQMGSLQTGRERGVTCVSMSWCHINISLMFAAYFDSASPVIQCKQEYDPTIHYVSY
jgi:hypothetical protein